MIPQLDIQQTDIETWFKTFEKGILTDTIYAASYSKTRQRRRLVLLLSHVGRQTYKLLKSLYRPTSPYNKTYKEIKQTLLSTLGTDSTPSLAISCQFASLKQQQSETLSAFMMRITDMALQCKFTPKATCDLMIRNQFTFGIKSERVRTKLLKDTAIQSTIDVYKRALKEANRHQRKSVKFNVTFFKKSPIQMKIDTQKSSNNRTVLTNQVMREETAKQ